MSEKEKKQAELKKLVKNIGKCIVTGREVYDEKKNLKTLKISPALDFALNGGVQEGSWLNVTGMPKTGKTSSMLHLAANAQKEGRKVIYLDAEGRLKGYNLIGIDGLDLDAMKIVRSPDDKILSAEEFLSILENLIQQKEYEAALVIIDSLSSLIPSRDLGTMVDGERRPGLPKILSDFTKRMGQVIPRTKTIVVLIGHFITNTSGWGKKFIPDGGIKKDYQADTMITIKKSDPWIVDKQKIGQVILWDIETSSLGSSGTQAVSYFRYGKGLDGVQEIIELAVSFDLVEQSGAWFSLPFMSKYDKEYNDKKYKFQGVNKLYDFLKKHVEIMKNLETELKEYIV